MNQLLHKCTKIATMGFSDARTLIHALESLRELEYTPVEIAGLGDLRLELWEEKLSDGIVTTTLRIAPIEYATETLSPKEVEDLGACFERNIGRVIGGSR